jgi:hypothetical protein
MYSLLALEHRGFSESLGAVFAKILLENLLRQEDGRFVKQASKALPRGTSRHGVSRNLLSGALAPQDFTGALCGSRRCATASCGSAATPEQSQPAATR